MHIFLCTSHPKYARILQGGTWDVELLVCWLSSHPVSTLCGCSVLRCWSLWTALPSAFSLGVANGRGWQETRGRHRGVWIVSLLLQCCMSWQLPTFQWLQLSLLCSSNDSSHLCFLIQMALCKVTDCQYCLFLSISTSTISFKLSIPILSMKSSWFEHLA